MKMQLRYVVFLGASAAAASLLAIPSCNNGQKCLATVVGGSVDPCVPTSTSSKLAPPCFDAPEACPDLSPVRFCAREAGSDNVVNLKVLNRGNKPLTVNSVKVRGDTRCAFKMPQYSPALGTAVEGGDSLIFQFQYDPPSPGDDHIAIEVTTNADNLPLIVIPVCGHGVPPVQNLDGGAPDVGQVLDPGPNCLPCKDQSKADYTNCWDQTTGTDAG
jgi:hypothetical protein